MAGGVSMGFQIIRKLRKFCCLFIVLIVLAYVLAPAFIPVHAAAASTAAITGLVAAALAYIGLDLLAIGLNTSDVDSGLYALLESYATYIGTTVSIMFPLSNVYRGAGALLQYGSTFMNNIYGFVDWLLGRNGDAGSVSEVVYSYSSFSVGEYKLLQLSSGNSYVGPAMESVTYGSEVFDNVTITNTGKVEYLLFYYADPSSTVTTEYFMIPETNSGMSGVTIYRAISYGSESGFGSVTALSVYDGWRLYRASKKHYKRYTPSEYAYDVDISTLLKNGENIDSETRDFIINGVPDIPSSIPDNTDIYVQGIPVDTPVEDVGPIVLEKVVVGELDVSGEPDNPSPDDPVIPELGLEDVFPFCIPFDLYRFFSVLSAAPEAPSFDFPFVIPGLIDYTFHVDLSEFNTVAQVMRTMELLGFCIGLALLTRNIIRG